MKSKKFIAAVTSFMFKFQLPWVIGTTCIGILFVLLPALSSAWRNGMAEWPAVYSIYEIFSGFKSFASFMFGIISIPLFVAALFGKHAYPGWDLKKSNRPTLSKVLQNNLYPKNWRGVAAFYSFLAIDLFAWLIPFFVICLISYFIKP